MSRVPEYEQELVDAIPVPMFFLDKSGVFVGSNRAFSEFVDLPDEDVRKRGVYDLIADRNAEKHQEMDTKLLQTGSADPYEDEVFGAGARRYFVIFRKALMHDAKGQVSGIVTTIIDVTDLKTAEENLVASESQKKAILDGFPGLIVLFDRNKSAIWVNDAVRQNVSMSIGRLCQEIICKRSNYCKDCAITKSIESGKVEVAIRRVETDDEAGVIYYEVIGTPIKNAEGEVESVIAIARDVTDRFQLERQLRHAQKMQAIGTLAGGIAHDFNNVLTPIMGYTEILKLKMRQMGVEDEPTYEYLSEILIAGKRAEKLVEQILTFSQNGEQKAHPQYIHPIAKEVIKLLCSTLPANIKIEQNIDEDCGPVNLDPVELQQVLINLCTNSADAIGSEQGTLSIEIKKAEQREGDKTEWIEITVSDTGEGISSEVSDRIFEPYFSTREKGYGTGMGLALVHSIVTRNGGLVEVKSDVARGAVFRVLLPVVVRQRSSGILVQGDDVFDGKGRIILVDDEGQVVQVIGELLPQHRLSRQRLDIGKSCTRSLPGKSRCLRPAGDRSDHAAYDRCRTQCRDQTYQIRFPCRADYRLLRPADAGIRHERRRRCILYETGFPARSFQCRRAAPRTFRRRPIQLKTSCLLISAWLSRLICSLSVQKS